jgi:nitroimidazol reductase NimA-like FMN-containing flavoprotein (pyridoxamine 5'-phosphate oxidase superfamily)
MLPMSDREIDGLLGEALIGRLSMAGVDGRPYSIPLPFCWANSSIYLRLPLKGRKGKLLAQNNRVCFEVDTFSNTLDEYASVLVEGRLVEVTDIDEKAAVKRLNDSKYDRLRQGHRPGHGRSTPLGDLPMRKIAVEQVTGRQRSATPALALALGA